MRCQFDVAIWNGEPLCVFYHPISFYSIRCLDQRTLIDVTRDLMNCYNHGCLTPFCIGSRGSQRHRLYDTIQRMLQVGEERQYVMPIQPGFGTIIAGSSTIVQPVISRQQTIVQPAVEQSSSSRIVRNVQVQPKVQKTVIEEHIHQPDPIVQVEKRTIIHQGGATWEADRSTTVTQGGSSSKYHGKSKSSGRKRRTPSPEIEEYSSEDDRHGRSNKKSTTRRLIKDRSESRDSDHGRRDQRRRRDRSRSRSRERDHKQTRERNRDRSRSRDRNRHSRREKNRERSTHRTSRRDESPREYDYASSSSHRSN